MTYIVVENKKGVWLGVYTANGVKIEKDKWNDILVFHNRIEFEVMADNEWVKFDDMMTENNIS